MLKLEKVTGGYANIPVLKDVTFEAVSYTHLTLPTNS